MLQSVHTKSVAPRTPVPSTVRIDCVVLAEELLVGFSSFHHTVSWLRVATDEEKGHVADVFADNHGVA